QSSAVAAAGAVPADAVGSHRKAAVTVSTAGTAGTAAPAGPEQGTDPAMQETMTIPTNPSAATAIPTATSWSSAAPPLQDSGQLPRARGA
ncbi:DNA polymerase III subunit gamma/tau, partial [Actinomyces oris]